MKRILFAMASAVLSVSVFASLSDIVLFDGAENGVKGACKIVGYSVVTSNANNTVSVRSFDVAHGVPVTNDVLSATVGGSVTNASVSAFYLCSGARLLCEGSAFTNGVVRLFVEN